MSLRIRPLPARTGLQWIRLSFVVLGRRPAAFAGLFGLTLLVLMLVSSVPYVGFLLSLSTMPLVSLGFMIATEAALRGQPVQPDAFFQPMRISARRRQSLISLGLFYATAAVLLVVLSNQADGGALDRFFDALNNNQQDQARDLMGDPHLQLGLLIRFGGMGLLSIPMWHSPGLVHWDDQGAPQAIFSSVLALWKTRGAFAVYTAGWFLLCAGVGLGGATLVGLLGIPALGPVLLMPLGLALSTAFYISVYFSFVGSFERVPAATDRPADDQRTV